MARTSRRRQKIAILAAYLLLRRRQRRARNRLNWQMPWIAQHDKQRAYDGNLVQELNADVTSFRNYFRMNKVQFQDVLRLVSPAALSRKNYLNIRDSIIAAN